jgi:hypothetical protein
MTVETTSRIAGPWTGTGADATLAFSFKCFDASEILVTRDDAPLGLVTDYSVSLNADQESAPGGSVTILAASNTIGSTVVVRGNTPVKQATSLPSQASWSPKVVEKALDRLAMILQETRSLISTGVASLQVDLLASTGSALVNFIHSGAGAIARSVQAKLRDTISVKDFGALGDGVTDDRAAIAAAVAAARGKRVIFPEGNYLINSDGGPITLEEVELIGEGVLDGATSVIDQGAMLWITGAANSPFKVRRGVSVKGLGFYYPNQADTSAPTAYPATFLFDFTGAGTSIQFVQFLRNVVYNAYKFIEIGDTGGNVGHVEIEGNYICALNRAIYLRRNLEHMRIERNNFTFSVWPTSTEAGVRSYMRATATAIQIDQSDGVEIVDNLIFGHLNGVLLGAAGLCQFIKIDGNKIDQTRYGVKATGTGNFTGQVLNNTFFAYNSLNTALQGRAISVDTSGASIENIQIAGNHFAVSAEDHIWSNGAATRNLIIGLNAYRGWAKDKTSAFSALSINGANTNVQLSGGFFYGADNAAYSYGISGSFNTLALSGAVFNICQRALSVTVTSLAGSGNRSFTTGDTTSDVATATTKLWGPNNFDKPQDKTPVTVTLSLLGNYANDAAAATAGVPVGGWYRNGSVLQVRAA